MSRMSNIEYQLRFMTTDGDPDFMKEIDDIARKYVEEHAVGDIKSTIEFRCGEVYDLDLSVRAFNVLTKNNIWLIDDLCEHTESSLMALKGMGKGTFKDLKDTLDRYGLKLKEEEKNG